MTKPEVVRAKGIVLVADISCIYRTRRGRWITRWWHTMGLVEGGVGTYNTGISARLVRGQQVVPIFPARLLTPRSILRRSKGSESGPDYRGEVRAPGWPERVKKRGFPKVNSTVKQILFWVLDHRLPLGPLAALPEAARRWERMSRKSTAPSSSQMSNPIRCRRHHHRPSARGHFRADKAGAFHVTFPQNYPHLSTSSIRTRSASPSRSRRQQLVGLAPAVLPAHRHRAACGSS